MARMVTCQSCDHRFDVDAARFCPECGDMMQMRCHDCGAFTDGDGYSVDDRACFYCRAD